MAYPDYPIPEQPSTASSYVAGTVIHDYLKTFAEDFQVREHIRFRHHVIRVRPIEDLSHRWEVRLTIEIVDVLVQKIWFLI